MAVLLPDCALEVTRRAHPWTRDARGVPMPSGDDATTTYGPTPGAATERADGSWSLRVDPGAGEIREGDRITDGTRTWVVAAANLHAVPSVPDADYIAVTGTLDPPQVP